MPLNHIARVLGGTVTGGQVVAPGPGHRPHDRSLSVKIGKHGKLIVHSHAGDDPMRCLTYVEQKLGVVWQPEPDALKTFDRMETRAIRVNGNANGNHAPKVDGRQAAALRIWGEGLDPRGTIVETYLASRALFIPDGVAMSTIRFHPNGPFGRGVRLPCMVAAMRSIETGAVVAIHRTALTPEGSKIDRMMLGPADGAAIMLAELHAERGALTVGEGLESAMSGLAMGFAPAWAMGSAGAIGKLPVLNGVDSLTILGEHDSGASAKAIRQVGSAWREAGREVYIAMPRSGLGNDANDAWRRRGHDDADVLDVREFGTDPDVDLPPDNPPSIKATPFVLADPRTIPTRKWLYGRHYIRQFVSATVATGGVGKSSLGLAEVMAMVTGKPLLGVSVGAPLKAWVWNGEDPREELERRISGICLHYGISAKDIAGRLFLDSGRDLPIKLVEMGKGGRITVAVPTVEGIERAIQENGIDLLMIDPFVSSHGVPENDNLAIDRVTKTWAGIADRTGCAIELVHHVRKGNGSQDGYSVEDARGGSSLIGAVRSARVLNVMSKDEAERLSVEPEHRRLHFRVDDGKANMAPPMDRAVWRKLVGVGLGNGNETGPEDKVGVVTAWEMPGVLDEVTAQHVEEMRREVRRGEYRQNIQAGNWAGYKVGEIVGFDASSPAGKARAKAILATWIATKALKIEQRLDEQRRQRQFVTAGDDA